MQDRSMSTVGVCGLALTLRNRFDSRFVNVDYNPWKTDWKSTAEWIYRWSGYDQLEPNGSSGPPTIMIVAYSWGAGWGLRQLCEYLADRGLKVQVVVASDAVRHIGWTWSHTLYISQILAYWPWWKIRKPRGIAKPNELRPFFGFYWYRQCRKRGIRGAISDLFRRSTLLYGHPWVEEAQTDSGVKTVECPNGVGVEDVNHTNMDDTEAFRSKVFELADKLYADYRVAI